MQTVGYQCKAKQMLGQSSVTDLMQRLVVCGRTVPGTGGGGGGGAFRKSLWGPPGSVLGGRRLAVGGVCADELGPP